MTDKKEVLKREEMENVSGGWGLNDGKIPWPLDPNNPFNKPGGVPRDREVPTHFNGGLN